MERLQKVIAAAGICSRRKAEELITGGHVKVNDKVITELGSKVEDNDIILVDNKPILKEVKEYYLLNKPREYICSVSDDKKRKVVTELIPTKARIYPVGRLDYDTTGVLLLTNDGDFANILMDRGEDVKKTYLAKVPGRFTGNEAQKLEEGVMIDDKLVKASKVKLKKYDEKTNTSYVQVSVHEGLNHEIKNMFTAINYEVLKLTREREFIFTLEGLQSGEYRKLTNKEIKEVYALKKGA